MPESVGSTGLTENEMILRVAGGFFDYRQAVTQAVRPASPLPDIHIRNHLSPLHDVIKSMHRDPEALSALATADIDLYMACKNTIEERVKAESELKTANRDVLRIKDPLRPKQRDLRAKEEECAALSKSSNKIIAGFKSSYQAKARTLKESRLECQRHFTLATADIEATSLSVGQAKQAQSTQSQEQAQACREEIRHNRSYFKKGIAALKLIKVKAVSNLEQSKKSEAEKKIDSLEHAAGQFTSTIAKIDDWLSRNKVKLDVSNVSTSLAVIPKLLTISEPRQPDNNPDRDLAYDSEQLQALHGHLEAMQALTECTKKLASEAQSLGTQLKESQKAQSLADRKMRQAEQQHGEAEVRLNTQITRELSEGSDIGANELQDSFDKNCQAFETALIELSTLSKNRYTDEACPLSLAKKNRIDNISSEHDTNKKQYEAEIHKMNTIRQMGWYSVAQHQSEVMKCRQEYATKLKSLVDPRSEINKPLLAHRECFSKLTNLHKIATILSCLIVVGIPYGIYRFFKSVGRSRSHQKLKALDETVPKAASAA
jgi:hypothetical protein